MGKSIQPPTLKTMSLEEFQEQLTKKLQKKYYNCSAVVVALEVSYARQPTNSEHTYTVYSISYKVGTVSGKLFDSERTLGESLQALYRDAIERVDNVTIPDWIAN